MSGSFALSTTPTQGSASPLAFVPDVTRQKFGLLIAYVIPGFVALWGIGYLSPVVAGWFTPAPAIPASLEAMVFIGLTSLAAGMLVSAFRWAVVDQLHHRTGLPRPVWDDANLQANLQAFDTVVDAHYHYYLFHANTAVAIAFTFITWQATHPGPLGAAAAPALSLAITEGILLATSRDNLRKYYARASRILGPITPSQERRFTMSNGNHPKPSSAPRDTKPAADTPKSTEKPSKA